VGTKLHKEMLPNGRCYTEKKKVRYSGKEKIERDKSDHLKDEKREVHETSRATGGGLTKKGGDPKHS